MKEYKKIIILSVILLILIIALVVVFTTNLSIGEFNSVALFTISQSRKEIDDLIELEANAKAEQQSALDKLEKTKNSYEQEKQKFEKIDEKTVELVKEATKDEKYFIEYLWITLGNYAEANNLAIEVITPGSTSSVTGESMGNIPSLPGLGSSGSTSPSIGTGLGSTGLPNLGSSTTGGTSSSTTDTSVDNGTIKIVVRGRYAKVADFVYDVENDKELKFRLDNIKMTYKSNNQIEATFNVLNLQVKK